METQTQTVEREIVLQRLIDAPVALAPEDRSPPNASERARWPQLPATASASARPAASGAAKNSGSSASVRPIVLAGSPESA